MPTIAQLRREPWWDREIITPELDWCGGELCRRTGAPAYSIGTKGDNGHLSGGHRSQEWIVNSDWCTDVHYTVQQGLTADQMRHIAALDRTPLGWGSAENRARMMLETGRLVAAGKAGKLAGVTQIQGTLDGVRTFGINLPSLNTSVPSDSHLDHWHLTFDRRHLRDAALMARIVDVVLGGEGEDDTMFCAFGDGMNGAAPSNTVKYLQRKMQIVRPEAETSAEHPLVVDGGYGDNTAYWVSLILTGGYGREVDGYWFAELDRLVAERAGGKGEKGDPGPKGDPGAPGETPTQVTIAGPIVATVTASA